ncbi:MAG TPA: phospholipid carrier-dependent glycosyltransferase [Candidatus Moranbacteria bacterium]|nr:phospholipid carrier-dependent glycosyltransferase [Candidatus Moranbacteria bacterium]
MSSIKNNFEFKKILPLAVVVLVMIINFGFGIYNLSKQAAVDEPLWIYDRIPKYWKNINERDWKGTRISDKPGVTVALTSGIGLLWENPKQYEKDASLNKEKLFFALRFPLFILTVLMLPVFYFFINRLLGNTTAMFSVIFIGLSPILLGISRIINPDSLLWIFMPLSLLSYFNFLKNNNKKYLYSSGVLLGLSLLTKYIANFFIIFFLGLIFLEYIFKKDYPKNAAQYVKDSFINLAKLLLTAVLVFATLFPATWIKPEKIIDATFASEAFETTWPYFLGVVVFFVLDLLLFKSKIFSVIFSFLRKYRLFLSRFLIIAFALSSVVALIITYTGMKPYDFQEILASPKSAYGKSGFLGLFLSGFYPLLFGLHPIVFFLFFFSLLSALKSKFIYEIKNRFILYSSILILLYYFGSTVNHVATTVRYQIILYALVFIISAIGLSNLLGYFSKKFGKEKLLISSAVAVIFLVATLYQVKPFYFSYASNLLPQKYVLNLKDMGDGSYEAAEYLNNLDDADNLYVWTDKRGVCTFFKGKCTSTLDYKRYITSGENNFDYFVATVGRRAKNTRHVLAKLAMKPDYLIRFDKLYTFENPDFQINLGGRESNFVKVIKADKIDLSYSNKPNKTKNGGNKKKKN